MNDTTSGHAGIFELPDGELNIRKKDEKTRAEMEEIGGGDGNTKNRLNIG